MEITNIDQFRVFCSLRSISKRLCDSNRYPWTLDSKRESSYISTLDDPFDSELDISRDDVTRPVAIQHHQQPRQQAWRRAMRCNSIVGRNGACWPVAQQEHLVLIF